MSNLSILERLENLLAAHTQGMLTRAAFVDFLGHSIRALKGVPFTVAQELREHEYAIETEGYFDEEGFESRQDTAQESLLCWIHELKRVYGK